MMDRNREARRAAAMANGLHRRRHRTTTNSGSLRDSPEDEGPMELQETARLRDRPAKKDRDRETRDRDRDRERERLSRSKKRRRDKYMHGSNSIREEGGGGGGGGVGGGVNSSVDDSSEESVNDDEDEDDDGPFRHLPPPNPVPMSAASTVLSHRKSYPPPSKVYRVTPSWKAPDEMIGVSIPRKARSASAKRSHECWSSGGVGGDQNNRQASSSPVMEATAAMTIPSPSQARPMSPSSSNISMKKKIKPNGPKQRPPKSSSSKSSPLIQDEIEIEVAEVLYGLMRQSQAPPPCSKPEPLSNDSAAVKLDSRSTGDSKSRVSSPIPNTPVTQISTSSAPLTIVAPKRKRPRPSSDENLGLMSSRVSPISPVLKLEPDQNLNLEAPSPTTEKIEGSMTENGGLLNAHVVPQLSSEPTPLSNNGILSDKMVKESGEGRNGMVRSTAKVDEASSSLPKLESSQNHDRVQLSSTSTKPNSAPVENENRREDKFEIDLMTPASPEKGEYGGTGGGDEKSIATDREMETKSRPNEAENDKAVKNTCGGAEAGDEAKVDKSEPHRKTTMTAVSLSSPSPQQHQRINSNGKKRNFDIQLNLENANVNNNDNKLNFQQQKQQLPRNDSHLDKIGVQSSSVPLPMSVPVGWHGGLAPMGYVGPLQGVVSMDGTMATPPIQPPPPHFLFSQPRSKRCATHGHIAKSISAHQQMMKMNPFWPAAAAAGTAQLFGAKPYNLNMVPSTDLHPGRGGVQDIKGQPFTLFPGPPPPATSKDKSPQAGSVPDSAQKKQFLLQPGLPPGSATNIMHGPALFFPMGQQQAAASAQPGSGKSPTGSGAASTSTSTSAPMGATVSNAPPTGPAMSFSYPNVNGNEAQFMAILGNSPYPFPIQAHVGAAPPYRASHPQAMSFFNGPFYSSQMLHPSQLQQAQLQQAQPGSVSSQSMQMQQQNHQIASMSTAPSSQKHLQSQQQRHQGSGTNNVRNPNQGSILQNFQGTKGRDVGGEESPSSADSRRPNMSLYGPNFPVPFHSPNFALIPSSVSGGASNGPGVPNVNNHDDKQQQQQQSQQAAANAPFPLSFTTINGVNTPGLDISSMAHNHAIFQSLPEAAKQSYQMMAAAAQAAQQRMSSYRGPDDGKNGAGTASDPSNLDDERRVVAARASAASGGQSIAFSTDLAENSVVDSSARSLNLVHGTTRPARSSGSNNVTNSSNSQQQQQQSQMLFPKQQQYTPSSAGNARSKTPSKSNGNVYPDHLTSSSIMAAKFPNSLSGFPSLVQTSGGAPTHSQWKNSVRPNTSQMSSPSITPSSTPSNMKNLPQQQGRPQQSHTQISFGAAVTSSKPNPSCQGPQIQNGAQTPSSPMLVGSPSNSSMSKSAGGSPRTSASNKSVGQTSTLSSQQGKNSPSPSLSSQKPSILGGPHIMSTSSPAGKPQLQQQPHQQPQLSTQSIQQAQLYFSNYMQQAANTSSAMAGTGYYLQRHPKSQAGSVPPTSSSGMLSLCTPVSFANVSASDSAKAVASNMKGGLNSQGMSQSGGAVRQLMPASLPYAGGAVPVKPTEQKQPAGE